MTLEERPRLYRLAVACPVCGAHPAVKVFETEIREKIGLPADTPVQTVQCPRCAEIYMITAAAYHRAA